MELKDLLNVALKIESTGYETYLKLSEENSGEIKELFERLALQEREHAETFKKIFEKDLKGESKDSWIDEENAGYLKAFAEVSIFPKLSPQKKPKSLRESINMAIEVEKDSILFYNDLNEFFPDKTEIKKIIHEEKKHMMDLLNALK